jgi:hypothetical protein
MRSRLCASTVLLGVALQLGCASHLAAGPSDIAERGEANRFLMDAGTSGPSPAKASIEASPMPPGFLMTGIDAWDAWLEGPPSSASFHRCPGSFVLTHLAGPADLIVERTEALDSPIELFDAGGMTRREALWALCRLTGISIRWRAFAPPRTFMGVPEHEERVAASGVTTMSEVRITNQGAYLKHKAEGDIEREETLDDFVYYAVGKDRDVPFSGGVSGWFHVVERYKVRAEQDSP